VVETEEAGKEGKKLITLRERDLLNGLGFDAGPPVFARQAVKDSIGRDAAKILEHSKIQSGERLIRVIIGPLSVSSLQLFFIGILGECHSLAEGVKWSGPLPGTIGLTSFLQIAYPERPRQVMPQH
jgi:hypothetical protein